MVAAASRQSAWPQQLCCSVPWTAGWYRQQGWVQVLQMQLHRKLLLQAAFMSYRTWRVQAAGGRVM